MQSQVPQTVWGKISGEAAEEVSCWSPLVSIGIPHSVHNCAGHYKSGIRSSGVYTIAPGGVDDHKRRGLDCLPEKTRRLRRFLPKLGRLQTRLRWPEQRVLARFGQDPPTHKSNQQHTASWAGGLWREHGLRRVQHVCCGRRSRQLHAERGGLHR